MDSTSVRITLLVDNQADSGLVAEHGFSAWIETEGKRILFDTGQGNALAANAPALGIDLSDADTLILSHGHYDHTGGIPQVLNSTDTVDVYCHPCVLLPRYSIRNGTVKPVHIPLESKRTLNRLTMKRLHWISRPMPLASTIGITGVIPRESRYEDTGGPFYLDPKGEHPDPISDDIAMWLQTANGLVIITGCCHAGLVNTLNEVCRQARTNRIHAVIGGFHLLNANNLRLEHTINAIQKLDIERIIPCHCTGETTIKCLKETFDDRVTIGAAGMKVQF